MKAPSKNRGLTPFPFLDIGTWGKGVVWINGRSLGRFWGIGPQQTLYCPGAWLKQEANELTALFTAIHKSSKT